MNKFLIILTITLPLFGCSKSVPNCSDSLVTDLVKQIADREMANQMGIDFAKLFTYKVEAIRTTNTHEKTGAHDCAAELTLIKNKEVHNKLPITYTVEKTDKSDEIYVNVFGL